MWVCGATWATRPSSAHYSSGSRAENRVLGTVGDKLRYFSRETSKHTPDAQQLGVVREQSDEYFKQHKFLKEIPFILDYVNIVSPLPE
jgi:hypothetical protein